MVGGRYGPAVVRVKEVTVGRGVRGKMGRSSSPYTAVHTVIHTSIHTLT